MGEGEEGSGQAHSGRPDADGDREQSELAPSRRASQVRVMAGLLSSRALGLVREILLAFVAGASAATDVLAVVFRAPNLVQNLLGEQALSASFIPVYSRFLAEGRQREARRFAGAVFGILTLTAGALALLGVALANPLVRALAAGFAGDALRFDTAVAAVRLIFPMTAVLVLSAWCLAVLNSHRRFFLPYFAPVLWNLSIIVALLWLASGGGAPEGVRGLVLAVCAAALLGGVLQFAVQLPAALRLVGGLDPRPSLDAPGVRPALRAFGPALFGRGVVQLSQWLDLFLGSWLATGALAALSYAQRLHSLPLALFGTSFAVVELPELSRLRGQEGSAARRLQTAFASASFLTVPAAVGLIGFGLPIVRAVYERGRFGLDAAWLVYLVLGAYSIGLVPSVGSRMLQNAFFAAGDTRTPATIALGRVLLSAGVGAFLMLRLDTFSATELVGVAVAAAEVSGTGGARAGAVGLALGSALGAWLELWVLQRRLARRALPVGLPWRRVALAGALSLLASAPAALVWWLLRAFPPLVTAPLLVASFAAVYLSLGLVLRLPEATALVSQVVALATRRSRTRRNRGPTAG